MKLSLPAVVLLCALPYLATAQVAILHIQVIEGEGAVNLPGRSARALSVEVTDEAGKPVQGAAVSFHLPEDGPGGTFGNGLRTEVAVTDVRGRASVRNLQVNRLPGRVAIRIVAAKEQARAGMVSFQYIAETASTPSVSRGHLKWVVIAVLAGGAAAAGAAVAGHSSGAAATPAAVPAAVGIAIGSPSITVGKP